MDDYTRRRTWSDARLGEVKSILSQFAYLMADFNFTEADYEEDTKECTDGYMCMVSRQERIALRVRSLESTKGARDFTIRSRSRSGGVTEDTKLRSRYVRYYFYGWTDQNDHIVEWMLIDVFKFLDANLIDRSSPKKNYKDGVPDGTEFKCFNAFILQNAGCLIAHNMSFIPGAIQTPEQKNHALLSQISSIASQMLGTPIKFSV